MEKLLPSLSELPTEFAFALKSLIIYDPSPDSRFLADPAFIASAIPTVLHLSMTGSGLAVNSSDSTRSYLYPTQNEGFANPASAVYDKPASRIAYTRTLKLLREELGPSFDLEKVGLRNRS
jgi:hypothetical protein